MDDDSALCCFDGMSQWQRQRERNDEPLKFLHRGSNHKRRLKLHEEKI